MRRNILERIDTILLAAIIFCGLGLNLTPIEIIIAAIIYIMFMIAMESNYKE